MGRTATVKFIVSVVKGPDPMAGSFQNVAMENIEAKPNKDVEVFRSNLFHSLVWEAMNEFPSYRFYFERFDSREEILAIDFG